MSRMTCSSLTLPLHSRNRRAVYAPILALVRSCRLHLGRHSDPRTVSCPSLAWHGTGTPVHAIPITAPKELHVATCVCSQCSPARKEVCVCVSRACVRACVRHVCVLAGEVLRWVCPTYHQSQDRFSRVVSTQPLEPTTTTAPRRKAVTNEK